MVFAFTAKFKVVFESDNSSLVPNLSFISYRQFHLFFAISVNMKGVSQSHLTVYF